MLKQLTTMRWRDDPSVPSAAIEVVGIDPAKAKALYDYQIVAGQGLDAGDGVLLESNLAESLGLKPGDSIRLLVSRGTRRRQAGDEGPRHGQLPRAPGRG